MIGLRVLSGFAGAAVLLLALIIYAIAGVSSPDSHDGCSAPAGDIQFGLAASAALGWIAAGATGIVYAATGRKQDGLLAVVLGAVAGILTGAWAIYLSAAC